MMVVGKCAAHLHAVASGMRRSVDSSHKDTYAFTWPSHDVRHLPDASDNMS